MRNLTRLLLYCLIVVSLSGCEVKNRVAWSPDGSRAAVMCNDGLRISNANGSISEPLIQHVDLVSWMPDSVSLLVVTDTPVSTWSEVEEVAPPEYLVQIEKTAQVVRSKLETYDGNWDKFTDSISDLPFLSEAAVFLKDNHGKLLEEKLGDKWKETENQVTVDIFALQVFRLDRGGKCSPGPVVYRSIRRIVETRINPQGTTALLAEVPEPFEQACPYHLIAVPLKEGESRELSQGAARYPDWSQDGQSALFIDVTDELKHSACSAMHIGTLRMVKICSESGELLETPEKPAELAKVPFSNECRVRSLNNGSILFSSQDLKLPATTTDIGIKQYLYSINPSLHPTTVRLIPKSSENLVGDAAQYFEANSSGTLVCIPSENGHVSVMNLHDGLVRGLHAHGFSDSKGLRFAPKWRTNDELCIPAHPLKKGLGKHSSEVVLWSMKNDTVKPISNDWPQTAVKDFLD